MRWRWQALLVVLPVAAAWAYLLLTSDNDPEALHNIVGCYRHTDGTLPQAIRVQADGRLLAGPMGIAVTGYSDKNGDALLPVKKVIVLEHGNGAVGIDRGYPLLIRAGADHRTLSIPSETRGSAIYARARC